MSIEIKSAALTPSTVNAGQGFVIAVGVTDIPLLRDKNNAVVRDKDGRHIVVKEGDHA